MDFSEFLQRLEYCPELFDALIRRQKCDNNDDMRRRIVAFFRNITKQDEFDYRMSNSLTNKRIMRIASRSGLDPNDAFIPMLMYDDLANGQFYANNPSRRYSEEEIMFMLTAGGNISLDRWFFVADQLRLWNPRERELGIVFTKDGDPEMAKAEIAFLQSIGSAFDSEADAYKEIEKRKLSDAE